MALLPRVQMLEYYILSLDGSRDDEEVITMETNIFNWRRLVSVCRKIHVDLYENNDIDKARTHLRSLKTLLDGVPQDGAIIEAEARALYYELSGDIASAIDWRLQEVSLIECLHRSIAEGD